MRNCFEQLRKHLQELVRPIQGTAARISYGLVAFSASSKRGKATDNSICLLFQTHFIGGSDMDTFKKLYHHSPNSDERSAFFTDNPDVLLQRLASVNPEGNEENLIALDIALDLPFGPLHNTKRVVALFTDEAFETGALKATSCQKIPELIEKLQARHIQLFMAVPESNAAAELAQVDRSEVEFVTKGGDGLAELNFQKVLGQIGKSISVSSMQAVKEPPYQRGLFGQEQWRVSQDDLADNDETLQKEPSQQ